MLARNLALARDLGAEVITTTHPDLMTAFRRIIEQHQITQIVIGRPSKLKWREFWEGGSILDRMARENRDVDIYIVRQIAKIPTEPPRSLWRNYFTYPKKFTYYWATLLWISVLTLIGFLLLPSFGWKSIGFIYLLGILTLSLFTGKGPILFAALLSALALDLFFVPPKEGSLWNMQDILFFIVYFFTAVITGILVTRVKHREKMLIEREEYTQMLYNIEREIALAPSPSQLFAIIGKHLEAAFNATVSFALRKKAGAGELQIAQFFKMNNKEMAVAMWTMKNGKPAGWSTDTLPSFETLFIPLRATDKIVGVMAFRPKSKIPLLPDQMNLLSTIGQRLASYIERYFEEKDRQKNQYMEQVEILNQNIINIVAEQCGEPVQKILDFMERLDKEILDEEVKKSTEQLAYISNNFKHMATLPNMLRLNKTKQNLSVFVHETVQKLGKLTEFHEILIHIPKDIPLLRFDVDLMGLALYQVLLNAITYSPQGSKITIVGSKDIDKVYLSVLDEGPGIPPEDLNKIFEKFYRIPGTTISGTGLGLPLAKTIIELHGGTIEAFNRPEKGAELRICIKT